MPLQKQTKKIKIIHFVVFITALGPFLLVRVIRVRVILVRVINIRVGVIWGGGVLGLGIVGLGLLGLGLAFLFIFYKQICRELAPDRPYANTYKISRNWSWD